MLAPLNPDPRAIDLTIQVEDFMNILYMYFTCIHNFMGVEKIL